jgi:TolB protein
MLVRVFRLTDKTGNALLKLLLVLTHSLAEGMQVFVAGIGRAFLFLVMLIGRPALWIGQRLWMLISLLMGRSGRAVGRAARQSSQNANQAMRTGMARRAARAEIQASITEDPLKVQNRILSAGFVGLLLLLAGVVLWATRPTTTPPQVGANDALFNASSENPPNPVVPDSIALSTPVPTATVLPDVLQARGSIAYVVRERGQDDIWALNIGSPSPLRLTNSPADERDPAWSPDGRRLAFASRQDGNWEIYVYDLPTGQTVRLTYDLSFQGAPRWSPDGTFLVYESYQGQNLDLYVVRVDGTEGQRITDNPAPDYSPAWSPDGRRIAFTSLRDGNQDIYLFSLDDPRDSASLNLTRTSARDEDYPAWSPDGRLLAYSAYDQGIEKIFVVNVTTPDTPPQVVARGRAPSWSPDGTSLIYAVDSVGGTQLVAAPYQQTGISTLVIGTNFAANEPVWSGQPLPTALVNSGGLPSGVPQALYIEQEARQADGLFRLGALEGVEAPIPNLNDRVNDSFNALRRRTNQAAGWDFLGRLEDAFWRIDRPVQPGEERRNWLMTGRAFAVDRQLIRGFPPQLEIVREDREVNTQWGLYVRVSEDAQNGELGEPLRRIPWDFLSRESGDVDAYNAGGRLRLEVPSGYYIDFSQVALDYGWVGSPAGSDWRANQFSINYWLLQQADGLTWEQAMLELYTRDQLGGFVATPTPQPG